MVRWPKGLHPQRGGYGSSQLAWLPGWHGSGQQPIRAIPVTQYRNRLTGVPLTGGQAQGVIASGGLTLQAGPQGLGTVWYPVQVTLSTTTGALDTSTALVYLGPLTTPATLVGTVFTGNGTVALAIPDMTPGQTLIVKWSGAHNGDIAAFNIIGTMDALRT